jgi:hypothetical protein
MLDKTLEQIISDEWACQVRRTDRYTMENTYAPHRWKRYPFGSADPANS